MTQRLVLAWVVLLMSLSFVGVACGDDDDGNPFPESRADFQARAERRLAQIDERIQQTEEDARDSDAREDAQNQLESLKDERASVQEKLDELKGAGNDSSEPLQDDIESSLDDLEEDADSVISELQERLGR